MAGATATDTAAAAAAAAAVVLPPLPYDARVHGGFRPSYSLTEQQRQQVADLRDRLGDVDLDGRLFADDPCLVRYLRAREWKLEPAEKLLRGTLQWRRETSIDRMSPEPLEAGASSPLRCWHNPTPLHPLAPALHPPCTRPAPPLGLTPAVFYRRDTGL
jgi:hypothetical protein